MKKKVKVFRALADLNRVRIMKMLEVKELCVCEITSVLGLAISTVSKHLALLREADLVVNRKDGKWVNYSINTDPKADTTEMLFYLKNILNEDDQVIKDKKQVEETDRSEVC